MSTATETLPFIWARNQAKFQDSDLDPYQGQWLAWSKEGDRILFHHADLAEVVRMVESSGRSCEDCVFQQIPDEGLPGKLQ